MYSHPECFPRRRFIVPLGTQDEMEMEMVSKQISLESVTLNLGTNRHFAPKRNFNQCDSFAIHVDTPRNQDVKSFYQSPKVLTSTTPRPQDYLTTLIA